MRDIRPIRNDADLAWAIAEVEQYFINEPEIGGEESDRFDLLSDLIEAYESKHHPMEPNGPMEPVAFLVAHMGNTGRTQGDLAKLFGSRQRASEVLLRKRTLSKDMIYLLNTKWHIPTDLLIVPYSLAA